MSRLSRYRELRIEKKLLGEQLRITGEQLIKLSELLLKAAETEMSTHKER
jgi:hypothetical protein